MTRLALSPPGRRTGATIRGGDCMRAAGDQSGHPVVHGLRSAFFVLLMLCLSAAARAAPPAPVTGFQAADHPDDLGTIVDLSWTLSADDSQVAAYELSRADIGEEALEYKSVAEISGGESAYEDTSAEPTTTYRYRLIARGLNGEKSAPADSETVRPVLQWFKMKELSFAAILLALCAGIALHIVLAGRGVRFWVRPIPGLLAIDEAVGRATETGKPCLFIPGINDIDQLATISGITILSRVSQTIAVYDADLVVPTARSLVMTAARDTVSTAYAEAGRPDSYREDRINYITDEQFGFAAAAAAMMVRERPAACFYFGQFYAESLFLAETGQSIGAIQIAGTNEISQLPFFVAACDYTLIAEEFFAASAYLSGEPQQLATIRAQDIAKLVAAIVIVAGCLWVTAAGLANRLQSDPRQALHAAPRDVAVQSPRCRLPGMRDHNPWGHAS